MATTGLRPDISLVASVAKMNTKLFPLGIPLGLPLLPIPLPRFDDLHVILPSSTPTTPASERTPGSTGKGKNSDGGTPGVKGPWTQEEDDIVRERVLKVCVHSYSFLRDAILRAATLLGLAATLLRPRRANPN